MTAAQAVMCGAQETEVHMRAELNAAHDQANALQAQLNQHVAASQTSETASAAELASTRERLQQAHSQVLPLKPNVVSMLLQRGCRLTPELFFSRGPALTSACAYRAACAMHCPPGIREDIGISYMA